MILSGTMRTFIALVGGMLTGGFGLYLTDFTDGSLNVTDVFGVMLLVMGITVTVVGLYATVRK